MKQIGKLVLSAFVSVLLIEGFESSPIEEIHVHESNHIHELKKEYVNKQVYDTASGEHTIYWADGVDAPLMSNDPSLLGTDGYFEEFKEVLNGRTFLTYQHEIETGKGYYDLNKDVEKNHNEMHHCYLGTAVNMLYWWFDQNTDNIKEYLRLLRETDTYGQDENLVKVLPYDEKTWTEVLTRAPLVENNGMMQQLIAKSTLVLPHLRQFYVRDMGHFPDLVIDNFINGYRGQLPGVETQDQNTEDNFVKDRQGGFFYNIFDNHRLTERHLAGKFENFNHFLREAMADEKIVGLSYFSPNGAHAITVWGAEYDENDDLMRIYITDTDDYYGTMKKDSKKLRGLHTMEVGHDESGAIFLYSDLTEGSDKNFGYLQTYYTLDAAKDLFASRLKDTLGPTEPTLISTSSDRSVALNGHLTLKVEASNSDNGRLSYEWYKSETKGDKGVKVGDTNEPSFKANTSKLGKSYYTVDVVNNKNGKKNIISSSQITIDVQDIPLVDAEMPKLNYPYGAKVYSQYSEPWKINSKANVSDGGTLTYQWYSTAATNGVGIGTPIEGATNPYFYPKTNHPGRYWYYCVVTNTNTGDNITGNQVTSYYPPLAYQVTVNAVSYDLSDAKAPIIENQPSSTVVDKNGFAKLETKAMAYDGGQVSYQWYRVNSNYEEELIEGATDRILDVDTSHPGTFMYTCYVTNTNTSATINTKNKRRTDVVTVEVVGEETLPPVLPSSDNKLKKLEVKNAKLSPDFNPSVTSYETRVHVDVDKLDITYEAPLKSKVTVTNPTLTAGLNKVTIEVKAEDGSKNVYIISVTKDSSHTYGEWIVDKEATCLENGSRHKVCEICGHVVTETTDKLGHNYGDYIIDKEATCLEAGRRHKICSLCGDVIYEEIPMKEHRWSEDWTIDVEPTENSEGQKSHHCLDCDAKKDVTVIPHLNHIHKFGDWQVIKNPTCVEDGLEQRVCSCGEIETRSIPATGHKLTYVPSEDATCLEDGVKAHYHCETCGKNYEDKEATKELSSIVIEAHGHSYGEWVIDREATETETGLKHKTCIHCGEVIYEEIPMKEPVIPEVPETSEPESPELPEIPEVPEVPETSEPESPELPEIPELPQIPEVIEPSEPEVPETSEPEIPDLPQIPENPEHNDPTNPIVPEHPEIDVPSEPSLPDNNEIENNSNKNSVALITGLTVLGLSLLSVLGVCLYHIFKK